MTPRKLAGVLLGFGGVAVMIGPALLGSLGNDVLAQLACLAGALCYALAGVWARRFKAMQLSPMSVTTGQLTAGAADDAAVGAARRSAVGRAAAAPSARSAAIVALALVCTAFAYVLYFRLIDSAGATNALLVTLLVPPVAILLGGLFLGEVLAPARFCRAGADRARAGRDRRPPAHVSAARRRLSGLRPAA